MVESRWSFHRNHSVTWRNPIRISLLWGLGQTLMEGGITLLAQDPRSLHSEDFPPGSPEGSLAKSLEFFPESHALLRPCCHPGGCFIESHRKAEYKAREQGASSHHLCARAANTQGRVGAQRSGREASLVISSACLVFVSCLVCTPPDPGRDIGCFILNVNNQPVSKACKQQCSSCSCLFKHLSDP